jgi:hypothetical protein
MAAFVTSVCGLPQHSAESLGLSVDAQPIALRLSLRKEIKTKLGKGRAFPHGAAASRASINRQSKH